MFSNILKISHSIANLNRTLKTDHLFKTSTVLKRGKKTSTLNYTVRIVQVKEVPRVLDLWKATKNHQGTDSLNTWMKIDPEGFRVAVTEEGEVVGACTSIIHHDDLAFFGLYVVKEKYRGLGISIKIWDSCMEYIGSRNMCGIVVPSMVKRFQNRDLPIAEKKWYANVNVTDNAVIPDALLDKLPQGIVVEPYRDSHLPSMLEYDYYLTGHKRDLIIELTCKEKDSLTMVALKNDTCVGFGTIKLSCQGIRQIGPLYADDPQVAEVILKRLIKGYPHSPGLTMMTVSTNTHANTFMEKIGCPFNFPCVHLYSKKRLKVDTNKVFAFLDLNFSPF